MHHMSPEEHAAAPAAASPWAGYDHLPMGVVLATTTNEILHANPEFFRLTECTPRDLEYMNFIDVLSLFCLGMCARKNEICCQENKWHNIEKYIRRQDGSSAWVRIHLATIGEGPDGLVQQLLIEDVSKYKETIDRLLNRKDLYRSIVEKRPDPICCFLPDWSLTYANATGCRCLGLGRTDIVGENFLLLLPPAVRERFVRAVESITVDTPAAEVEQQVMEPGERPIWLRWVIQGFFYKTGHIKDYQAIGMDISEQKVAESRFLHADRLVSLGTLVSSVAHEINNPNNFIMLNAPLLEDLWARLTPTLERSAREGRADIPGSLTMADILEHVPQLLQGIVEGAERIRDIVRELKTFARQDNDSGFELLNVNDAVSSAVMLMRKTIGLHTERFTVDYGAGLPLVRGRRQRLEQVVVNLVQNACNALEHAGQAVAIRTVHDAAGGAVRIEVRDEGVGIPPEDLPRVTDPFYSTRRAQGGTGLGLSISLAIAREHGGRLLMDSVPGRGTMAVVALPAAMA